MVGCNNKLTCICIYTSTCTHTHSCTHTHTHTHTMQQVQPPPPVRTTSDVKQLFKASDPEGTGESSRIEELVHVLINNELDVNTVDDSGVSLLNGAIKVTCNAKRDRLVCIGYSEA